LVKFLESKFSDIEMKKQNLKLRRGISKNFGTDRRDRIVSPLYSQHTLFEILLLGDALNSCLCLPDIFIL